MPRGFSSGHMSEDSQLEANAKEVASAKKEEKTAAKARGASVDPSSVNRPPSGKKESTGKSIEMTDLKRPERPERPTAANEGSSEDLASLYQRLFGEEM